MSSHPNYSNCDTNIDAEKGVCSIKEDSPCCLGCALVGAVDALGFQRDGLAQELPRIDVGLAHLDLPTILIVTGRPNPINRSKQGRELPSQESYLDAHLVVRATRSFAGVLRVRPPTLAPAVIKDCDDLANGGSKSLQS